MRYLLTNNCIIAAGGDNSQRLLAVLDYAKALRKTSTEVLRQRKIADEITLAAD